MAELVDALDSKSSSARSAGSTPARGTKSPSSGVRKRPEIFEKQYLRLGLASRGVQGRLLVSVKIVGVFVGTPAERQLAHVDNDSVRRAYARADFWEERVRMMAWSAERREEMRRGGIVIPLRA